MKPEKSDNIRIQNVSYDFGHRGPQPIAYAVSVQYLFGPSGDLRKLQKFKPIATAGYSIRIFEISEKEADTIRKSLNLDRKED